MLADSGGGDNCHLAASGLAHIGDNIGNGHSGHTLVVARLNAVLPLPPQLHALLLHLAQLNQVHDTQIGGQTRGNRLEQRVVFCKFLEREVFNGETNCREIDQAIARGNHQRRNAQFCVGNAEYIVPAG